MDSFIVRLWDDHPRNGGKFIGTGFFIDSNKIMTARHILDDNQNDSTYISDMPDKSITKIDYTTIISLDRDIDILTLTESYDVNIYEIDFNSDIKRKDLITIVGFIDGEQSIHNIQSQITGKSNLHRLYALRGFVGSGMSGSPVIRNNKIIGVIQATDRNKNTSYLIPMKTIHNQLSTILTKINRIKKMPNYIFSRINRDEQVFYILNDFLPHNNNVRILIVEGKLNSGHRFLYERLIGDLLPKKEIDIYYQQHDIKWGCSKIDSHNYFCMNISDSIFGEYNLTSDELSEKIQRLGYNHVLYYEININNIDIESIKHFLRFWRAMSEKNLSVKIIIFLAIKEQNEPFYKKIITSFIKKTKINKYNKNFQNLSYPTPYLKDITMDELTEWLRDSNTTEAFNMSSLQSKIESLYRNKTHISLMDIINHLNTDDWFSNEYYR